MEGNPTGSRRAILASIELAFEYACGPFICFSLGSIEFEFYF